MQITICQYRIQDLFSFTLVTDPSYLVEIRLCQLFQYMCEFDSRAIPLLTIIRYWAKVNKVILGESRPASKLLIPAPASLDWLVISWMVRIGLVPSPQQIIKRRLHVMNIEIENVIIDTGFLADREYAEEWKGQAQPYPKDGDASILDIIQLAQLFFEECFEMKGGRWLLNTRTAEIISMKNILNGSASTQFHVLNPFSVAGRLHVKDFTEEAFNTLCEIMEETGKRLREYLGDASRQQNPRDDLITCLKSSVMVIPSRRDFQQLDSPPRSPALPSISTGISSGPKIMSVREYKIIAKEMWQDDFRSMKFFRSSFGTFRLPNFSDKYPLPRSKS